MATATTVKKGFSPICPKCSEPAVSVHLDDVSTFTCRECSEDFDLSDIQALLASWAPVLAWLDTAPVLEE